MMNTNDIVTEHILKNNKFNCLNTLSMENTKNINAYIDIIKPKKLICHCNSLKYVKIDNIPNIDVIKIMNWRHMTLKENEYYKIDNYIKYLNNLKINMLSLKVTNDKLKQITHKYVNIQLYLPYDRREYNKSIACFNENVEYCKLIVKKANFSFNNFNGHSNIIAVDYIIDELNLIIRDNYNIKFDISFEDYTINTQYICEILQYLCDQKNILSIKYKNKAAKIIFDHPNFYDELIELNNNYNISFKFIKSIQLKINQFKI